MRVHSRLLLLSGIFAGQFSFSVLAADLAEFMPRFVPWPRTLTMGRGSLTLSSESRIVAESERLLPLAKVLAEEVYLAVGRKLATGTGEVGPGDIGLRIQRKLKNEAYRLEVQDSAIVLGGDYQAVALGTATLLQALNAAGDSISIPRMRVEDEPAYPYRAAMIDLARKYHSPGGIKQVIELCRLYKIRYLHVHLSDDQLFMFPSKAFPQLGKGNWEFARFEPGSKAKIEPYTREALTELERFSQERGVSVVPEIDMPGHAGRLVDDSPGIFGFPGSGATLNIANPKTLQAVAELWTEVIDVFQGTPYVHLGGDEVGLGGLEGTAEYKELQKAFPQIRNAHDLYCKFMRDMHAVFAQRGKKMIVWEEACNPDGPFPLPKDTLIMVWCQGRNPADIVRNGYSVVNATWTPLYIVRDNCKTPEFLFHWKLPEFGREGSNDFFTLTDTSKLAGAQLCSWENSEAIEIQYMRRRLAVVAEKSWNPQAGESLGTFQARWASSDAVLDKLIHPIEIRVQGAFVGDESTFVQPIRLTLLPRTKDLAIRYTLDNGLPNRNWKTYTGPITLEQTAYLRAGLFDAAGRQHGYLVGSWFKGRVPAKPNLATNKPVTVGPSPDRTDAWGAKNAVDGRTDDVHAHWASEGPAPQWLRIDLEKVFAIDNIKVITYYDGSRYYHLNAELSVDGKTWKKMLEFKDSVPATAAGYSASFPKTYARYVRINMLRNSANPYVHIVEVMVNEAR